MDRLMMRLAEFVVSQNSTDYIEVWNSWINTRIDVRSNLAGSNQGTCLNCQGDVKRSDQGRKVPALHGDGSF